MADSRLAQGKALAATIHARLVPYEDLIYRVEDILLFHRPIRARRFFAFINAAYLLLYFGVKPTAGSVVWA
jgi:hypothetical protein